MHSQVSQIRINVGLVTFVPREMLVQLLVQMWMWMVAAFIYYGFSFSWGSIGSNIYISYLYAAVGEVVAYTAMAFPLEYWGRKPSNILFYLVGKK